MTCYRVLALTAVGVIFYLDAFVPTVVAISVLYALVVVFVGTFLDRKDTIVAGCTAIVLTLAGFLTQHWGHGESGALVRCLISLSSIALATYLVLRGKSSAVRLAGQAALLDLSHDAIIVRDRNGTITYWNRGAQALYGWAASEAIGRNKADLLGTRFPLPMAEIEAVLARTGRWEGELAHSRRDGSALVVASRWSLHGNAAGEDRVILETNNDITRQKSAFDRLSAAEQELRLVIATIPGFVWSSGEEQDSVIHLISQWQASTLPEGGRELRWRDVLHPDDAEGFEKRWKHALAEGEPFETTARLRIDEREFRRTLTQAAPLKDAAGKTTQWYGITTDIEDLRRTEDALHAVQAELSHAARVATLGELTASIAHEINQPLAAVVTNSEAGLRWLDRPEPRLDHVRTSLEKASANGRRASDVVARLRALARRSAPDHAPVDINEVVHEVLPLLQREMASHRVRLDLRLAPVLPPVQGDRVQLQQVLLNLALNGVQAMHSTDDRDRYLTIATHHRIGPPDGVLVEVRDSGQGLDAEQAARLFMPFFTTKAEGMGMGLSISKSIVEAHQGEIGAANNADGGATLTIRLPVAPDGPQA